ncbi:hypothetical protein SAMN04488049_107162, partial [Tritonibacter multivorans]
ISSVIQQCQRATPSTPTSRGQKQDRNANLSAHRLPYIKDVPVSPERLQSFLPSRSSFRPVITVSPMCPPCGQCSVSAAPRSASAPPVKGVLRLYPGGRKRFLHKNANFLPKTYKNNQKQRPTAKPLSSNALKTHRLFHRKQRQCRQTPHLPTGRPNLPTGGQWNRTGIAVGFHRNRTIQPRRITWPHANA